MQTKKRIQLSFIWRNFKEIQGTRKCFTKSRLQIKMFQDQRPRGSQNRLLKNRHLKNKIFSIINLFNYF